ncbi:hypothetical protein QIS74_08435 [Colletotrichum tabaci]|uniref:Uncharacterized protein n=1 Tax=Colletotrichum tabaci TaxID=1209068 RepID=A0AAV9T7U6_9PEZI
MSAPIQVNKYRLNKSVPQEVRPWWYSSMPPTKAESIHNWGYDLRKILKTTAWSTLPGSAGHLYTELKIVNPYAGKWTIGEATRQFWMSVENQAVVRSILGDGRITNAQFTWQRRVFINRENAGHFGSLTWRLTSRTPAVNSLLIQAYGVRNGAPCNCCARSFQKFVGSRSEDKVRSMSPYFECVSLPDHFNNRCANCMFGENISCDFETNESHWEMADPGVDLDKGKRHKRDMSGDGVASLIPRDIKVVSTKYCMLSDYIDEAARQMANRYKSWCEGARCILDDHPLVNHEVYQRMQLEYDAAKEALNAD